MENDLFRLAEKRIVSRFDKNIIQGLLPHQETEPRGNFKNYARRVIRPRNTIEVSNVLSILNELNVKVIVEAQDWLEVKWHLVRIIIYYPLIG